MAGCLAPNETILEAEGRKAEDTGGPSRLDVRLPDRQCTTGVGKRFKRCTIEARRFDNRADLGLADVLATRRRLPGARPSASSQSAPLSMAAMTVGPAGVGSESAARFSKLSVLPRSAAWQILGPIGSARLQPVARMGAPLSSISGMT